MGEDSIYPPNFNDNLDMNVLGPTPRPDGSMADPPPQRNRPDDVGILGRHGNNGQDGSLQTSGTEESPAGLDSFFNSLEGIDDSPGLVDPSSGPKRRGTTRANQLVRGGACEFCKKRKLKCTAEKPTCAACKRLDKPCVYSQKKQRSRVKILEDRLIQLEKKLEGSGEAAPAPAPSHPSNSTASGQAPATTSTPAPSGIWGMCDDLVDSLDTLEPDLMTLADAAASDDGFPWDGLTEDQIIREIINAVDGVRGVGDHIVRHLLHLYIHPNALRCMRRALDPRTFLARLQPHSTDPPHPALILSMIPYLMPFSPSPILSRCVEYSRPLEQSARVHMQQALAVMDYRLIDIVFTTHIMAYRCYRDSRLLEGWGEGHAETSLAWAAGLGKMRGIGESFLAVDREPSRTELANKLRGEKLGELVTRMALVEPPRTVKDYDQRVHLFWVVYALDKGSSSGFNFPSGIIDEEVTTPWPQDVYDEEALREKSTVIDLLQGRANTGFRDSDFCVQVKGLCLLNHAARLFDLSSTVVTPERIANLKKITRDYMASLHAPTSSFQASNWQTFHMTMMFLHMREEVELERSANLALEEAVKSAEAVAQLADVAFKYDPNLSEIDLAGLVSWQVGGALVVRTSRRLERDGDHARASRLRAVAAKLLQELAVLSATVPYAKTMGQLLENLSVGSEFIVGKYPRKDRLD